MDIFSLIGVLGSIASIIALFLPAQGKKQRVIYAIYVFIVVVLVTSSQFYQSKLRRIESAERAAIALLERKEFEFTQEGFIQAALAFMEKNRDIFPDSYVRAQELCKNNDCLENPYGNKISSSLTHGYAQIHVASALDGMLKGIAKLSAQ